jgi:hypothetical protein
METKVITAPLAIIKVQGVAVGKMKSIRIQETIRRGRVSGLGALTPDELPALEWSGTLSCGFYNITFDKSQLPKAIVRTVNTIDEFVDTVLLQEEGIQVDIMRKARASAPDPNTGIIPSKLEMFASVKGCHLTREGFDIQEGQISGKDADFDYKTPIIFAL